MNNEISDEEIIKVVASHFKGYAHEAKGIFLDMVREALVRFGTRPAADPSQSGSADDGLLDAAIAAHAAFRGAVIESMKGPEWDALTITEHLQWMNAAEAAISHRAPAASGSAGEAASDDFGKYVALAERCGAEVGRHEGQMVWMKFHRQSSVEAFVTGIAMLAALSRQAPAAPAAVDFEQWWTSEVVANGGAPIGADYKHWAKAGFELRGGAREPAAPAEALTRTIEERDSYHEWADKLADAIGKHFGVDIGEHSSASNPWAMALDAIEAAPKQTVRALVDRFLGWRLPDTFSPDCFITFERERMQRQCPTCWPIGTNLFTFEQAREMFEHVLAAPTPAEPQALLGWTRYEKARKLNVAQWAELHQRNLRGENFDDMIDALPATTQPVQQDTLRLKTAQVDVRTILEAQGIYLSTPTIDAIVRAATPPAEKQAAPSGEDNHG
jgi:hypothetical protein